jgi:hypothetical protein
MWKFIRVVKRMNSKVVMVSEDGKNWRPLETAYGLEGDFDIKMELENKLPELTWGFKNA